MKKLSVKQVFFGFLYGHFTSTLATSGTASTGGGGGGGGEGTSGAMGGSGVVIISYPTP